MLLRNYSPRRIWAKQMLETRKLQFSENIAWFLIITVHNAPYEPLLRSARRTLYGFSICILRQQRYFKSSHEGTAWQRSTQEESII